MRTQEEECSGDSFLPPPGHAFWRQRDVVRLLEEHIQMVTQL